VPATSTQLVVGVAAGTESSRATLQRYEKQDNDWVPVGPSVPARLGVNGLAWGSGLHPEVPGGMPKKEGDGRSPMGIFAFGQAFADQPPTPAHGWPILQTTVRDLWVEDPQSEAYNTHVRVPEGRQMSPWEVGQRMRLGDAAHQLKVVVNHNADPPVAGAGSAIFLHIWRKQGERPTSGCTSLPEGELKGLLDWLDPAREPVYALLTEGLLAEHGGAWGLPPLPGAGPGHTPVADPPSATEPPRSSP
jgi:L,D-peptidoglycan transpeptidase YkuD (ErfK/YbiS/YcfS/YnhG family)